MNGWLDYLITGVGVVGIYAGTIWLFLFSPWRIDR